MSSPETYPTYPTLRKALARYSLPIRDTSDLGRTGQNSSDVDFTTEKSPRKSMPVSGRYSYRSFKTGESNIQEPNLKEISKVPEVVGGEVVEDVKKHLEIEKCKQDPLKGEVFFFLEESDDDFERAHQNVENIMNVLSEESSSQRKVKRHTNFSEGGQLVVNPIDEENNTHEQKVPVLSEGVLLNFPIGPLKGEEPVFISSPGGIKETGSNQMVDGILKRLRFGSKEQDLKRSSNDEAKVKRKWSIGLENLNIRTSVLDRVADCFGKREKTTEEVQMEAFWQEIRGKFLLTKKWKLITWLLAILVGVSSIATVAYLGTHWEKNSFWIGAVFWACFFTFLAFHPFKMLLQTVILSYMYELAIEINKQKIHKEVLSNPHDDEKMLEMEEFREKHEASYRIDFINEAEKMTHLRKAEAWTVFIEAVLHFVLTLLLYGVVMGLYAKITFSSSEAVKNLVVHSAYTRSRSLLDVYDYKTFMEFMPILLSSFTLDPHLDLFGVVRLRQIRVDRVACQLPEVASKKECYPELNNFNADTNSYGPGWRPLLPGEGKLNLSNPELYPWTWRKEWENRAAPVIGRFRSIQLYTGGGYVIDLGIYFENSLTAFEFIKYYNWIDSRSRALFVEFTMYSEHANLFFVVLLIFEISASGVFIPSYSVKPVSLLFPSYFWWLYYLCFAVFVIFLLGKLFREFLRVSRLGMRKYLFNFWTGVEFLFSVFSIGVAISAIARLILCLELYDSLERAKHEHFSFHLIALWDSLFYSFGGFALALGVLQKFRLLTILADFNNVERLLRLSWAPLLQFFAFTLSVGAAFAFYFYLAAGPSEEKFGHYWTGFPHTLAFTSRFHASYYPSFLNYADFYVTGFFFFILILFAMFMSITVFQVVLCFHFPQVSRQPVRRNFFVGNDVDPRKHLELDIVSFMEEIRLKGMKNFVVNLMSGQTLSPVDHMSKIVSYQISSQF